MQHCGTRERDSIRVHEFVNCTIQGVSGKRGKCYLKMRSPCGEN